MKDYHIVVTFADITGKTFSFDGLNNLVKFLKKENEFWTEQNSSKTINGTRSRYIHVDSLIKHALTTIKAWEPNFEGWGEATTISQITQLIEGMKNRLYQEWLHSENILTTQMLECQEKFGGEAADSFIEYTVRKTVQQIANKNIFLGIMFAYELENQKSEILKRRHSEKKSFQNLRDDLEESRDNLVREVDNFKDLFNTWKLDSKSNWERWIESTNEEWKSLVESKKVNHEVQIDSQIEKFDGIVINANSKFSELEERYEEKLRFAKPATYWDNAAKRYKLHGILWMILLISSLALGLYLLSTYFQNWLIGIDAKISLNTIQGVIIFATILATYGFMVRTLSKLTFSSFHLQRDAEERAQLTYLYLALTHEQAEVDVEARKIILQALFSRSETGLLTGDSSPTMPGGISEIMKLLGK